MKNTVSLVVALFVLLPAITQAKGRAVSGIQVTVDARVELMSVIFRLAGHPEYNMKNSQCAYVAEVDRYFAPFASHPVVDTARRLRRESGVSYDAPMSLAVHVDNIQSLKPRAPLKPRPARLDKRFKTEDVELFLKQARDFVARSKFTAFFENHREAYQRVGRHLEGRLKDRRIMSWFKGLFGKRPGLQTRLVLSAINGGQSYGASYQRPDGSEEVYSIIGLYQYDAKGMPVFSDATCGLIVHEFAHSYVNPLVFDNQKLLEKPASRLFALHREQMTAIAYGSWQIMACESLVRAVVQLYLRDQGQPGQAAEHLQNMKAKGFPWVASLVDELDAYRKERKKAAGLKPFLPRMAGFFAGVARAERGQDPKRPRVLSMIPVNGSNEVDPALSELVIVFDRPMRDSWSFVGGGDQFPELGKPFFDASRKKLTVPVKLRPDWKYQYRLNSDRFQNFASSDGVPLRPVKVEFQTRRR